MEKIFEILLEGETLVQQINAIHAAFGKDDIFLVFSIINNNFSLESTYRVGRARTGPQLEDLAAEPPHTNGLEPSDQEGMPDYVG